MEVTQHQCRIILFQDSALQETWTTQNQHQVDFFVFLEVKHLYQQVGCARNRRRSHTVQQKPRLISLDAGLRMDW